MNLVKTNKDLPIEEHRERLERKAAVIRSRLLRTIDALDQRRHQIVELSRNAKELAFPVGALAAGAVVVSISAAIAVVAITRSRRKKRLAARVQKLLGADRPSILEDVVRKVAVTLVGVVAAEIGRRVLKNAFDGRAPSGKLVATEREHARLLPAR